MASVHELLNLVNCTIRFRAPEGEYEGLLKEVFPAAGAVIVGKLILLPDRRMGALNFRCSELANLRVIHRPDDPKGKSDDKEDILPVYPKTMTEKLFDFDAGSDIEDDESTNNLPHEYEMKLVRHLSKWIPRDFAIIDTFNRDFELAIQHIRKQDAIGVSLEGIKISRSGILTWLCISTPCCNFLFDILALGKQVFKKGLKSILENARIQKIFHDCRLASDCLYHKYGVRLVNVFDTQVADFVTMMQMVEKDKMDSRVNTLDACLNYYLEVPSEYLYSPINFDNDKDSLNFHALRPLKHEIQDVLIKNVMYLHLLKRELELALQTPLRRATDVYLNSVQKLHEKELLIVPHKPDELPLDIHLEGIQIFRYRDFEYLCSGAASGPPYREIHNPIMSYLNYRAKYKNGQRNDKASVVYKNSSQNSHATSTEKNYKASVDKNAVKPASGVKADGNPSANSNESDRERCDDSNRSPNYQQAVKGKFKASNCEKNSGNPVIAAGTSLESSANDRIATLKSVGKECAANIDTVIPKPEPVQINNSVMKKDVDISDYDLKEIEARVRARGALVRDHKTECPSSDCLSTSDPFSRRVQDKLVKEADTLAENQKCPSEEVTIYYSETLNKPSQIVVKVNHKRTPRLADLYRKAGDASLLWTEEGSEIQPKSSRSQPPKYEDSEDFWATVRGHVSCNPIDEKLRARLIPAGMAGC